MNLLPKPKAKSLRRTLATAVLRSVGIVAAFGGAFTLMGGGGTQVVFPEAPAVVAPAPAPAPNSPEALLAQHDCWTGEAPADMVGVVPGHVVTNHGLGGSRMVGKALEQIFEGQQHGITVYGFCR